MRLGLATEDSVRRFYDKNGFLVAERVFSGSECDEAVAIFKKYAKPDFRGIMNLERGRVEYREVVGGREVSEEIFVDEEDAAFVWKMISCPDIVAALELLQQGEVVHLQSMFLFKEAGSPYAEQAWNPHQDNAYPQADYGMYITGNFAFSDQEPSNGGMRIYPESHREPILPNVKVKSFHEGPGERPGHTVEVPPQYRPLDLILEKGSVLFLHGNVIHDSYPNRSNRSRPMLLVPYGTRGITKCKTFLPGAMAKRCEASLRGGHHLWREAVIPEDK